MKTVYLVLETTESEAYPRAFASEAARDKHVKGLLRDYSKEYGKRLKEPSEVFDASFGAVRIETYSVEVVK